MSDNKENLPETKYKIGDWVYYNDRLYKIYTIAKIHYGWIYVLETELSSRQVTVTDGDKYFRKA